MTEGEASPTQYFPSWCSSPSSIRWLLGSKSTKSEVARVLFAKSNGADAAFPCNGHTPQVASGTLVLLLLVLSGLPLRDALLPTGFVRRNTAFCGTAGLSTCFGSVLWISSAR